MLVDSNNTNDESPPVRSSFTSNALANTFLQHVGHVLSSPQHRGQPEPAIFRLLVLADPQIEGDSALPDPDDGFLPRLRRHWDAIRSAVKANRSSTVAAEPPDDVVEVISPAAAVQSAIRAILLDDIPFAFKTARKRLDLFGNDYYLAHIYRTLHWWSRPTHVTVLGDLIGSQWVTDEEFAQRGWRYWNRVFRGGERVGDDVTITGKISRGQQNDNVDRTAVKDQALETLQRHNSPWENRIINIAGNHDVGYAGDVSEARLERFERTFGRANWDVRFRHPEIGDNPNETPTLHIINLNDLAVDGPPLVQDIQSDSYAYLNDVISHRSHPVEDRSSFTILLTHVPLHKREGICTDPPAFSFFDHDDTDGDETGVPRFKQGGLREQNHLSEHVSTHGVLQGIFGMSGDKNAPAGGRGRKGLILTGHDHTGCDVLHSINRSSSSPPSEKAVPDGDESSPSWHWDATRYSPDPTPLSDSSTPSIREVTLRSMMGEYGGNAALLSVWFDTDPAVNEWRYEIGTCAAGVQHIWWAIHIVDVFCLVGFALLSLGRVFFSSERRVKSDDSDSSRRKNQPVKPPSRSNPRGAGVKRR